MKGTFYLYAKGQYWVFHSDLFLGVGPELEVLEYLTQGRSKAMIYRNLSSCYRILPRPLSCGGSLRHSPYL